MGPSRAIEGVKLTHSSKTYKAPCCQIRRSRGKRTTCCCRGRCRSGAIVTQRAQARGGEAGGDGRPHLVVKDTNVCGIETLV